MLRNEQRAAQKGRLHMNTTLAAGRTLDMVYIGVFAVIIAICSWITLPFGIVSFTMQTFAVFLTVDVLGGKRGTSAVLIYLLLGAVGVPVFAGFSGGIGVILGQQGGYLVGFFLSALVMWALERVLGKKLWSRALSMVLGLLVLYGFGTFWFMAVYTRDTGAVSLMTVLGWCVFPFVIPDGIKIALALILGNRLSLIMRRQVM